jgi:hypothetical protein
VNVEKHTFPEYPGWTVTVREVATPGPGRRFSATATLDGVDHLTTGNCHTASKAIKVARTWLKAWGRFMPRSKSC